MRTIKFRAWVKPDNGVQYYSGMYPIVELGRNNCVVERASIFAQLIFPLSTVEVMQYTGLKDRNGTGKEAYYCDICVYDDDSGTRQRGVIQWSQTQARFYLQAIGGDDEGNQDGDLDRWFKIIGNVFENPELKGE